MKKLRAGHVAREADVGERDRVAVAIAPGLLLAREMRLERPQRLPAPVLAPLGAGRLVELVLMLEKFAHPRHHQRMGVAGDDLREAAHARPAARIGRQQRRLRMHLVEIFDDRERLVEHRAVILDQRRDRHHRIDLAEAVLALLPLDQVDVDHLVRREALEVERDAHAEGRERPPEGKEFHARGSCYLRFAQ